MFGHDEEEQIHYDKFPSHLHEYHPIIGSFLDFELLQNRLIINYHRPCRWYYKDDNS